MGNNDLRKRGTLVAMENPEATRFARCFIAISRTMEIRDNGSTATMLTTSTTLKLKMMASDDAVGATL